jgi:hypothetical protein
MQLECWLSTLRESMKRTLASLAAALLASCGGSSVQVDSLVPVAAGLHQCSPSPAADTQAGDCTFAADGKITFGPIQQVQFTAVDGTPYNPENQDLPAAYKVANLSVHIEATRLKSGGACPGSCNGLQITINTISK